MRSDRGSAAMYWVIAVCAIMVTIVVWHILTGPLEELIGVVNEERPPENTIIGTETYALFPVVWNLVVVIVVLGIIVWAFVRSYAEIWGVGHGI